MRKMSIGPIAVFSLLYLLIIAMSVATTRLLFSGQELGDFRGFVMFASFVAFAYLYGMAVYRLFLYTMPLGQGELRPGSREEFAANVNVLFYIMLLNSLVRTNFLPTPLMRVVYLALGARLGNNTYSAGAILDPPLTHIGDNCLIGHNAVLFAHVIEGSRFSLHPIRIGNGVTVGANAVVMAGVTIGDGAIVSAGAVVRKGTQIPAGETWGGVPARHLQARRTVRQAVETQEEIPATAEPALTYRMEET